MQPYAGRIEPGLEIGLRGLTAALRAKQPSPPPRAIADVGLTPSTRIGSVHRGSRAIVRLPARLFRVLGERADGLIQYRVVERLTPR
jgi:hypothetical protein